MLKLKKSGRLEAGDVIAARSLVTIGGERVAVPDPRRLVHLQFRRFAGCPVCNLHLQSFARRHEVIVSAGVREVVVFHSSAESLRVHEGDLPFAVIADPARRLYGEFGVEASLRALLDPRAWPGIVRAVAHSVWAILRRGRPVPSLNPAGGRFGLPADFLIDGNGHIRAVHYGVHADDHWSVDELLELARTVPASRARAS